MSAQDLTRHFCAMRGSRKTRFTPGTVPLVLCPGLRSTRTRRAGTKTLMDSVFEMIEIYLAGAFGAKTPEQGPPEEQKAIAAWLYASGDFL